MARKQTAILLSEEEKAMLIELANDEGVTRSAMMRILIRRAKRRQMTLKELLKAGGGKDDE